MGSVVSADEEKAESVYAKKCFEMFTVADVYKVCARSKRVMAPVMAERRLNGQLAVPAPSEQASDDEEEASSVASSSTDSKSHNSGGSDDDGMEVGALKPLTSLFGVDLSFSDYFNVFGPGSFAYVDDTSQQTVALPLEVYKLFDRDKKGKVPALELFMALALYSSGHVKDRMAFCFMVFDDDGNNSLDREEMLVLIRSATRTLFKLGDLPTIPSRAVVKRVRDDLFSKYSVDGEEKEALDINDFFEWAKQSQHSAALMDKFNRVAAQLKEEAVEEVEARKIHWTLSPVHHRKNWGARIANEHSYDFSRRGLGPEFLQAGNQLRKVYQTIEEAERVKCAPPEEHRKYAEELQQRMKVKESPKGKPSAAYVTQAQKALLAAGANAQGVFLTSLDAESEGCEGRLSGMLPSLCEDAPFGFENLDQRPSAIVTASSFSLDDAIAALSPQQKKQAVWRAAEALGIKLVPPSPMSRLPFEFTESGEIVESEGRLSPYHGPVSASPSTAGTRSPLRRVQSGFASPKREPLPASPLARKQRPASGAASGHISVSARPDGPVPTLAMPPITTSKPRQLHIDLAAAQSDNGSVGCGLVMSPIRPAARQLPRIDALPEVPLKVKVGPSKSSLLVQGPQSASNGPLSTSSKQILSRVPQYGLEPPAPHDRRRAVQAARQRYGDSLSPKHPAHVRNGHGGRSRPELAEFRAKLDDM